MILKGTNSLKKLYYFINDSVVYDIKGQNDADRCGQPGIIYEVEQKFVKSGETYIDGYGQKVVADEGDGLYWVSTGKINEEECAKVYPFIGIEYHTLDNPDETLTKYLWFQHLVSDGDTIIDTAPRGGIKGGGATKGDAEPESTDAPEQYESYGYQPSLTIKFQKKPHDSNNDGITEMSYYDMVTESIKEDIEKWTRDGYSIDVMMNLIPFYYKAESGDRYVIDGKECEIESIQRFDGYGPIDEEQILEIVLHTIENDIRNTSNKAISPYVEDGYCKYIDDNTSFLYDLIKPYYEA